MTATIAGTAQTFNVSPLAISVSNGGLTMVSIEGFSSNSSTTESLAIAWTSTTPGLTFGTGTYYDTVTSYATIGTFVPSVSQSYVSGSGVTGIAAGSGVTVTNHLKIIITAVDSTSVKGTFSGDFYYMGDITGAVKTITNGDFDVPWKK